MAFGMLAIASFQITLSRNSDVAKQRTEATRLAQQKMEKLRTFDTLTTYGTSMVSSTNLTQETVTTNAAYTVSWGVSAAGAVDTGRTLVVTVAWTDRAGDTQQVQLFSQISATSPVLDGGLWFPLPDGTILRRPKNRNINIPVPAVALGGGKSAYQLASGVTVVFSDTTGGVVDKCTGTVNATTYANGTAGCTSYQAYIVAGYVSGAVTTSGTSPFAPTLPTGVNTYGVTGWDNSGGKTISCVYTRAVDQNNTSTVIAGYHYYLCVVPITLGGTWDGTIRLGGVPTNANYKVCRFQYPSSSYMTANMQNIQPYAGVNQSLDNQNYYIENSNNANCPTISGLATTLHQNCRSSASPSTTSTGTCPLSTYNTPS
jgi:hypothetical protein